jgi:DNA-nicking Smr family endonuclease
MRVSMPYDYQKEDEIFKDYIKHHRKENSSPQKRKEDEKLFLEWLNKENAASTKKEPLSQKPKDDKSNHSPLKKDAALFKEFLNKNSIVIKDKEAPLIIKENKKSAPKIPIIDLHGFTKQEALRELLHFIENLPQNIKRFRIIHGKGKTTGKKSVIREIVREWLVYQKTHTSFVKDYSYESAENGGHGATIVWLK